MTSASRSKGEDVTAVPHPSEFIAEELMARGWSADDLALRMSDGTDHDYGVCRLALDFYDIVGPDEPKMFIGDITSTKLGKAFGCSPGFFVALEDAWRAHLTDQEGQNR